MRDFVGDILAGDSGAVVDFYGVYSPRILRYLVRRLPRREDAQEVVNDVFLEAIDSLVLLKRRENLRAWLFRIAHNKMVDFYRKRRVASLLLSQVPYLEIVASEFGEPEFQFEKERIRERVEGAIHGLSERYRKILWLRYEEGVPVKVLAVELGLSFKAAESLLYRARKEFQRVYGGA